VFYKLKSLILIQKKTSPSPPESADAESAANFQINLVGTGPERPRASVTCFSRCVSQSRLAGAAAESNSLSLSQGEDRLARLGPGGTITTPPTVSRSDSGVAGVKVLFIVVECRVRKVSESKGSHISPPRPPSLPQAPQNAKSEDDGES
jgi:hypothetical protein